MEKKNKNQLVAALKEKGIAFEKKMKVAELRRLYDEALKQKKSDEQRATVRDVTGSDEIQPVENSATTTTTATEQATIVPNNVNSDSVPKSTASATTTTKATATEPATTVPNKLNLDSVQIESDSFDEDIQN